MNELSPAGITTRVLASALGALLLLSACAKKELKPLHTEPWLAHPPASAAASSDAGVPAARYAITEQSQIHFELPSKQGTLHGSLTHVSGELSLTPSDLEHSHGQVQVDLSSLTLSEDGNSDTTELLTRARSALGLTDATADAGSPATASFELSSLEDVSPAQLEPAPDSDAGAPFARKARATAVGNLLLHGFRVVRRAPLEAEIRLHRGSKSADHDFDPQPRAVRNFARNPRNPRARPGYRQKASQRGHRACPRSACKC